MADKYIPIAPFEFTADEIAELYNNGSEMFQNHRGQYEARISF